MADGSDFEGVNAYCAVCRQKQNHMKICTRCRGVLYCSRSCQSIHWPKHKVTCKPTATCKNDSICDQVSRECGEIKTGIGSYFAGETPKTLHNIGQHEKTNKNSIPVVGARQEDSNDLQQTSDKNSLPIEGTRQENSYDLQHRSKNNHTKSGEPKLKIFIKHNHKKHELNVEKNQNVFEAISSLLHIPVTKLKVIHKGRLVNNLNICDVFVDGTLFLAFGEVTESEEGLDQNEIKMIMDQLDVDRNVAVKALRHEGNVVDAILQVGNNI
ncbi:ubiquitin carboxyl-terminal hydrolase 15 [Nematostella vectensis]|uniref:ubiquitin carboxyl-terminal hydrolase 15 n=1 Tax=Nematostella vectensis TaxID=45351 RepID=UPI00139046CD|nr:ubiquitin carboxyl-terminal hydrolase 15 [Nematostella vectensis]